MSIKDMTGFKSGRLAVIGMADGRKNNQVLWRCRCDCGNETTVMGSNLRSGGTKSCGCLEVDMRGKSQLTHGLSKTREYAIWAGILRRCYDPNRRAYDHYGGRGIVMCEEWRTSVEKFIADMGPAPSSRHSVDRIDNDGNYEPANCRWASYTEQVRNRRNIHDVCRQRDEARAKNAELLDRVEALEAALREALQIAHEGWGYAPDYFRDKWMDLERLAELAKLVGVKP